MPRSTRAHTFAGDNTIEVQGQTFQVKLERLSLCVRIDDKEVIYGDTIESLRTRLQARLRKKKSDLNIAVVVRSEGRRWREPGEYKRAILRGYDERRHCGLFTLDDKKCSGLDIVALSAQVTDAQLAEANRLRVADLAAQEAHTDFMEKLSRNESYYPERMVEAELQRLDKAKAAS